MLHGCRDDIRPPVADLVPIAPSLADAAARPVDSRGAQPQPSRDTAVEAASESPDGAVLAPDGAVAAPDAAGSTGSTGSMATSICGRQKPDLAALVSLDGLAIGRDGTIYYTRAGEPEALVGRLRPGGAPVSNWARIPAAGDRMWGLALDSRRSRLYAVAGQAIFRIDVQVEPPAVRMLVGGLILPNDLAVDGEGNVYFSERGDGKIHRVTPEGTRNEVTPSSIGPPNSPGALAFGPDHALYAGTYYGPIVRIELAGGVERSRAAWSRFSGRANGLAFDALGRLYVGTFSSASAQDGQLVRIDHAEAEPVQILESRYFSSLAFGRGALDCQDLYVAIPDGPARRLETDTPGGPTSW
jgi:sugar lactone lactonase YvrE